jgi:methylated-DNA-[protein]-cysteine S-methyltransferase
LEFGSSDLPVATGRLARQLRAYAAGKPFQQKVWRVLQTIPHGQTRSYAWVAKEIGRPTAVRAVGAACGANPVGIIVPCHRVAASDGSLGGYTGGLKWKRRLLKLEGAI